MSGLARRRRLIAWFRLSSCSLGLRDFVVWSRMAFSRPIVVVLLLTSVSPTRAQDAGNQMAVVAALRTPASAESVVAIRAGLRSPDARVRAAAGRVASVSDPSRFVGDLLSALAAEGDGEAAREEAWALAIGDPVGFLGPILKAAERSTF